MSVDSYREKLFSSIGFTPTSGQNIILSSPARLKLVAGGERGGKSVVGSKDALAHILLSKLIWLVGVEYDIPRTEYFYLVEDLEKLKMIKDYSESKEGPLTATTKFGCKIQTKSAKDFQKLGMEPPDYVLVCEAAQIELEAYLRLRGRIAEKRAPMTLTGTFEKSIGWYADFFTRWLGPNDEQAQSFSLPSWDNPIVYPGGRTDPEIIRLEAQTPKDIFDERYGGIPCKPSGLIMKEFNNAVHVGDYNLDPNRQVDITVDPGYAGAHVVEACQWIDDELYIIDEVYITGYTTEDIILICKQKPWWSSVSAGSIDIAAKQHQAMKAPVEVWMENTGLILSMQKLESVEDGIDMFRTFMKLNPITNRTKLHVSWKCKGLISECGGGVSPLSGGGPWVRDPNTFKEIDKNNHACKAVIYQIIKRLGYTPSVKRRKFEPIRTLTFGKGVRLWQKR